MMELDREREAATERKLAAFERQMASYQSTISRFERILIANNLLDSTSDTATSATHTARAVVAPPRKDRFIAGVAEENPRYSSEVTYSDDGLIFTEPLVNPIAGTVYQVRLRLTQHHAGIEFQGVQISWPVAPGWTWADGRGQSAYYEFISNPLVIARLATYHSGDRGFREVVAEWYR